MLQRDGQLTLILLIIVFIINAGQRLSNLSKQCLDLQANKKVSNLSVHCRTTRPPTLCPALALVSINIVFNSLARFSPSSGVTSLRRIKSKLDRFRWQKKAQQSSSATFFRSSPSCCRQVPQWLRCLVLHVHPRSIELCSRRIHGLSVLWWAIRYIKLRKIWYTYWRYHKRLLLQKSRGCSSESSYESVPVSTLISVKLSYTKRHFGSSRCTCPAVSHSCRRTVLSSRYMVFDKKSIPMVALWLLLSTASRPTDFYNARLYLVSIVKGIIHEPGNERSLSDWISSALASSFQQAQMYGQRATYRSVRPGIQVYTFSKGCCTRDWPYLVTRVYLLKVRASGRGKRRSFPEAGRGCCLCVITRAAFLAAGAKL